MSTATADRVIHLVLASDVHYVMPLTVAMCSVAAHCDKKRTLVFHVIQSGIDETLRGKVEASLAGIGFPDARVEWTDAPVERIGGFSLAYDYTTCLTFARLLIPDVLPASVGKALYLDCDIAVTEDIGALWDTDLGAKALFAVRDAIGTVSQPGGLLNYRELNIPADAHYFNAGVLLVNVRKWRERDIPAALFGYLSKHRAVIQMADQEALNAVLWDDWGELDYRWNWQIVWRGYRLGRAARSWVPGTARKSIVHFITDEKPWLPGCDYEEKRYFFQYLDRTAWAGLRLSWWQEMSGRSRRRLRETRDAAGRLRRRLARLAPHGLVRR